MAESERGKSALQRQRLWRLHKDGREIACVVTALEHGGWTLEISRSDREAPSVLLFAVRELAIQEARRLAASYVGHGWALTRDER